jgi:hypothetical protein
VGMQHFLAIHYLQHRYIIRAKANPIATFLVSLADFTGFLSDIIRQMHFTIINKT